MIVIAALQIAGRVWTPLAADESTAAPPPAAGITASAPHVKKADQERPGLEKGEGQLLLDETAQDGALVENMADNSRCEVCHLNLAIEELALKHARVGVGCAKCHGECDAHIADESWASGGNGTAPDVMYPRDKLASGCMACHNAEQVFLKAEKHRPDAWLIACEVKTCTECHGKHRLPFRKCKWK